MLTETPILRTRPTGPAMWTDHCERHGAATHLRALAGGCMECARERLGLSESSGAEAMR